MSRKEHVGTEQGAHSRSGPTRAGVLDEPQGMTDTFQETVSSMCTAGEDTAGRLFIQFTDIGFEGHQLLPFSRVSLNEGTEFSSHLQICLYCDHKIW